MIISNYNNKIRKIIRRTLCCLLMAAMVVTLMPALAELNGSEGSNGYIAEAASNDVPGLSVKNLWASQHDVGRVKFKWTVKDGVKATGWNLEYRMRKIGGNNKWSGWTYLKNLPVSVGGANEKAGKWISIPTDYVIEIHVQAVGDTTWSTGIITTPAGGKYQAMKYSHVRYAGTKQRVSDNLVIGLGKNVTVTPDCDYPVKDTKKRPKLYPNHMLYDVADTSVISIKNAKGAAYKGGIIDGNARITGNKVGETTLIFRAPNGRTQVINVEVVDKVSEYTSAEKTFVFFGSDSRATGSAWKTDTKKGTEGKPRSDCIMIFRFNPKAGTIDLVSVYRDTMLDVSGKSNDFQKANKAFADGGPKKAVEMLERNLNIKISGYAVCNFKGVADLIDEMGGITINIETDKVVSDYAKTYKNVPAVMNNYINEMNRVYGTKVKHVTKTGKQKLTGLQAVAYARVRYTDGGDMRRTVRQRAVVTQMISTYKGLSRVNKLTVVAKAVSLIDTNMSLNDIKALASLVSTGSVNRKVGFPFYKKFYVKTTKKERLGKSNLFVPCDLKTNVVRLHKTVYGQKKYTASSTVKTLSKKITSETKLKYKNRTKAYDNKY